MNSYSAAAHPLMFSRVTGSVQQRLQSLSAWPEQLITFFSLCLRNSKFMWREKERVLPFMSFLDSEETKKNVPFLRRGWGPPADPHPTEDAPRTTDYVWPGRPGYLHPPRPPENGPRPRESVLPQSCTCRKSSYHGRRLEAGVIISQVTEFFTVQFSEWTDYHTRNTKPSE